MLLPRLPPYSFYDFDDSFFLSEKSEHAVFRLHDRNFDVLLEDTELRERVIDGFFDRFPVSVTD